jgi:serine/threonine protein kinase
MVMPFYPLGDLASYLRSNRNISKYQSLGAIIDISYGLRDIHQHGIAHLDIKPENILLNGQESGFRCLITDFGISTVVSQESMAVNAFRAIYRRGFSVMYAAPEIMSRTSLVTALQNADIYSFAVIIKHVLTRQIPWIDEIRRGLNK